MTDQLLTQQVWTLNDLAAEVALVLSDLGLAQASGRVREVPDRRTIRYYTTLGLVDRPVGFRGRTALYTWAHLEQLVAIKRLQQKGLSLSEVQEELVGRPAQEIEALAAVPESYKLRWLGLFADTTPQEASAKKRATRSFWKQAPVAPSVPVPAEEESRAGPVLQEADVFVGVQLAPGIKLLLEETLRTLEPDDIEALQVAASPLIACLQKRHIRARSGPQSQNTKQPAPQGDLGQSQAQEESE